MDIEKAGGLAAVNNRLGIENVKLRRAVAALKRQRDHAMKALVPILSPSFVSTELRNLDAEIEKILGKPLE